MRNEEPLYLRFLLCADDEADTAYSRTSLRAAVEEDCACLRSGNFTLAGTGLRTSATHKRDEDFLTPFSKNTTSNV